MRVTRATCDVRAQAAGDALQRAATVDAEAAGAGWPVRARTITREKLVARVRDVDFDVARRLASSKLLYGSVKCDVVAETQLYGGLFPTTVHSNVGTAWEPTHLASKQKLFKKGSPKKVWRDLRALAALVKDSLELSIDEDGALAARWTESRTTIRLPAGMAAVTLRVPRVPYDLTGRAGGAGTHHAHQRLGRRRHAQHVGLGVGDRRERRRLRRPQPCDAEADAAQRTRRAHVRPRHEHHEVGAAL